MPMGKMNRGGVLLTYVYCNHAQQYIYIYYICIYAYYCIVTNVIL